MPMLIDYYTIHEMDEGRIGFAPHNESTKPKLKSASQPMKLLDGKVRLEKALPVESAETLALVISLIILSCFCVVLYYGVYPWLWKDYLPDNDRLMY